jgi:hypothetical protein
MILKKKTLEILRDIINEKSEYRSGPKIVSLFNDLGFSDTYGQGFPSRWMFTDEKLSKINGTPEIDKCIKKIFDPEHYIGKVSLLDSLVKEFNSYLAFDGWKVNRADADIIISKYEGNRVVEESDSEIDSEKELLEKEFGEIDISRINLNPQITSVLVERIREIKNCISSNSPLSVIFLCGSVLEGILLGVALFSPMEFNSAKSAPIDRSTGIVKKFPNWSLSNFIDVAYELGYVKTDVKKYSHSLRDFRNYIHPYQQMAERFSPDQHTAKISWQVLKAAIVQIIKRKSG